jgi:hypothetical protein
MSAAAKKPSSRDRVRAFRAARRALGLRPVTLWLPDTRSDEFRRQAHLQSVAAAGSPTESEDQEFVDAVSELKF